MVETADVRRRVLRTIDAARRQAAERRTRTAEAEREGRAVLSDVIAPLFKMVAAALTAEGHAFRVTTPSGTVRLERGPQDFIEVALDTTRNPPALVGRTSRAWGRRVLDEEQVVREAPGLGAFTDEDALEWVLGQLAPFVER